MSLLAREKTGSRLGQIRLEFLVSLLAAVSLLVLSLARSDTTVKVGSNLTRVLGVIPGTVSFLGRTESRTITRSRIR